MFELYSRMIQKSHESALALATCVEAPTLNQCCHTAGCRLYADRRTFEKILSHSYISINASSVRLAPKEPSHSQHWPQSATTTGLEVFPD